MTRERFMELAKKHEIIEEHAEGLWEVRPEDTEDMSEESVEAMLTSYARIIANIIARHAEILEAREKAGRN
jgi:hypothetical protein